jgi:L,D-transpeptidase ErfK/SrfK
VRHNKYLTHFLFGFLASVVISGHVEAAVYSLPSPGNDIVGQVQWTQVKPGDTFSTLGRRFDVGYFELVEANPGIDPDKPETGSIVVIPSRYILPKPRAGIVINLAELRLFYYPPHQNTVVTYPVGIGREGWQTPEGPTTVIEKVKNPTWYVPPDIKADRAKNGIILPNMVPPGPDDPLGGYALYLGFPGYRIHGTNDPAGVGRRSSSGCIRVWPEDVESLFDIVNKGTKVTVVNDAFKAGWQNGKLYLESHVPLQEQQAGIADDAKPMQPAVMAATMDHPAIVDWTKAEKIAKVQNGIPQQIGVPASSATG